MTADCKEVLEDEVKSLLERFLGERGLMLSPTKTVITNIEDGFDFLGQTVRKYNGKYATRPSKKAVLAFLKEAREVIKGHSGKAGDLVRKLNPMIRGWVNYHRHAASSTTFSYVDHMIWQALWRWAIRRHPQKGRHWVARKYFHAHHGRHWVFTGQVDTSKGDKRRLGIFLAKDATIRLHVLIKGAANPFDPEWDDYFRTRKERRRKDAHHDRHRPRHDLIKEPDQVHTSTSPWQTRTAAPSNNGRK